MPRRVRELMNLTIDEVSLVDKGANQYATVTIAKRDAEEDKMDEEYFNEAGDLVDLSTLEEGDVVFDSEGEAFEYSEQDVDDEGYDEDDEVEKAFGGAARILGSKPFRVARNTKAAEGARRGGRAVRGAASGAAGRVAGSRAVTRGRTELTAARGIASDSLRGAGNRARATGGEAFGRTSARLGAASQAASMQARALGQNRGFAAGAAGASGVGLGAGAMYGHGKIKKNFSEEISKALSEAITDSERDEVISKALGQMEDLAEIAKAAEDAAMEERDMRLDREYTEIAKSYAVGVDPEELGPVLKRLAEYMDYEDCVVIAKALDSASAANELLDEIGTSGLGSNSNVLADVDSFLEQGVSKAFGGTREEQVSKTFEMNPEAYDAYLAERSGR